MLFSGLGLNHNQAFFNHNLGLNIFNRNTEIPGFDLRQLKDLINEIKQMGAAFQNLADMIILFFRQWFFRVVLQKLAEP